MRPLCFECGAPSEHDHHVVPSSRGGTKTVPLCDFCHAKVHDVRLQSTRALTKAALAVKKDRHELTGNAPYGWRVVPDSSPVQLEPDPEEQAAAALARELRARGESLRRIAVSLDARGVKTRGGGQWKAETVRGLIAAPEAT
jgi:hypothetical protein